MFSFYATIIYIEREEGDQARVVGREREDGAPPLQWPRRLYMFTGHSPQKKKFRQVIFILN